MRVLVATTAGSGHFGPLQPFAAACQRAGHDVAVAAPASFAAEVERAGFPHLPFADAPPEAWAAVMERLPHLSYEEAEAVVITEVFGGVDLEAALPGMLATVEDWRPDLVVRESAELSSHLAAERFGVPEIRVAAGLGSLEAKYGDMFASGLAAVRRELALDAESTRDRLWEPPWCTFTPPLFEHPDVSSPPATHRFRRPDARAAPEALPSWWPDGMAELPLVYVTFGTVANTVAHFAAALPHAVRALAGLPARLLVTVGQGSDPASLGELPANVHVERFVAQDRVLADAAAVVCHGGYGTTLGALTAGVPLVVSPQFADQPYNAERVAQVGAGVALPLGPPDPTALGEALSQVLTHPSYRQAAEAVAADGRSLPPVDEAVVLFERVAAGRR